MMKVINVKKLREETYKNLEKIFVSRAYIKMSSRMGYAKSPEDTGLEVKELKKAICIASNKSPNDGLCLDFDKDGVILWQQNHSLGCFKWKGNMYFCDYPSKTVFMMKLTVKVMDFLNK